MANSHRTVQAFHPPANANRRCHINKMKGGTTHETLRFKTQLGTIIAAVLAILGVVNAQEAGKKKSSYAPVDIQEDFAAIMARMKTEKPEVIKRQTIFHRTVLCLIVSLFFDTIFFYAVS